MDTSLDRARLAAFVTDVGDVAFAVETVQTYLGALDDRVAALTAAVTTGDRTATTAVAHTLASTSALLGATALAGLCRELEHGTQPAPDTGPAVTVRRLSGVADDTRRSLLEWLDGR